MKLIIVTQPPVVGDKGDVGATSGRSRLAHHQRPVEAAGKLLPALVVGVVPESPRVTKREAVGEAFARLDSGLGQIRNTVHLVQIADPVPVHRRRDVEIIGEDHLEILTALGLDHRAGRHAVIKPKAGCRPVGAT